MTYNEFIKRFNDYKSIAFMYEVNKYEHNADFARKHNISKSMLSRMVNGLRPIPNSLISKLIGKDICEVDIQDMDPRQLEIEYLEARLRELKGETKSEEPLVWHPGYTIVETKGRSK